MTRSSLRCLALFVSCTLTSAGLAAEPTAAPTAEQLEFFEAKIRPVLVKHCYECHSTKLAQPRGGLRLDDREAVLKGGDSGPAIVVGDLKKSFLIEALKYEGLEMPPKGVALSPAVMASYAAKYDLTLDAPHLFSVYVKDGALYGMMDAQALGKLIPLGNDTFAAGPNSDLRLIFTMLNGKPTKMTLRQNGKDTDAPVHP